MILQLLGWVMLPVYIASGCHTLPEYMKQRFGGSRIRVYLAVLSLILYIFTKVSVRVFSAVSTGKGALQPLLKLSFRCILVSDFRSTCIRVLCSLGCFSVGISIGVSFWFWQ